ncbi:MAG: glycerophosphodiester phosphodiesterase family protein [Casimicrobiaceae bacterium]
MTRPKVVAHRGSSAGHADNSWPAFHAALDEGADAIECDVQVTRDGLLVIRHDLAVDGVRVADLTAAELASRAGEPVTLQQLLAWAEPTTIELLVELKDPDAAAATAAMIAGSALAHRCVLAGFSAPALVVARNAHHGLRTSFMMGSVADTRELISLARASAADGVHLCWEARAPRPHRLLDHAAIARLRDAGLAITLWHEERVDELRSLVALGPDAICTNTPAVLRWIVDALHAPDPSHASVPMQSP